MMPHKLLKPNLNSHNKFAEFVIDLLIDNRIKLVTITRYLTQPCKSF